ncbi:lipoxygenase [Fluviicoccus keumensis]|uniref:Lipoxygenase n=1 Tax=Fluviicoccus keumensis TaxID=1435465 RepID=A0A4Q7Z5P9_9GAMM|nr:lipoxygenase family protein [Fluviicoccus keumensis]RZU44989.1 lipoxygenase [Fluviicoccus keumensis]
MLDFFPRRHPSLPQNDTQAQQESRAAQLAKTMTVYEWTDQMPNVQGVPMAARVPFADEPSLPWLLQVGEVGLQIAENLLAVKLSGADDAVTDTAKLNQELGSVRKRLQTVRHDHEAKLQATPLAGMLAEVKLALQELARLHTLSFETLVADFQKLSAQYALPELSGGEDGLAAYNALFKTLPLPPIAAAFREDAEFARLRVAGPNPMLLTGIDSLPAKFPLSDAQYRQVMGDGDSLAAAGKEHRLYLLDYQDLVYLAEVPGQTDGLTKYVYAPIALFAVDQATRQLKPVAIRCGQDPAQFPLFQPADAANPGQYWGWQMAKSVVQVAEGNYHELYVHLARTHLVIEAFAVATHRCLAERHPLNILLQPHFEGTLFINQAAAKSLIAAGGPIDHIFGAPIARTQQAAGTDRLSFDFYEHMFPRDLTRRRVNDAAALPDYPYRDDGWLVWEAIHGWVNDYLRVYYTSDADINGDTELAAWTASLISEGKIRGFKPVTTVAQLVDVVTMIIFTASAQHAAVNFPQAPDMTYAPAISGAGWTPAPAAGGHDRNDWLALLPSVDASLEQLNVLHLLGSVHFRHLGEYRASHFPYEPWLQDSRITGDGGPLERFRQSLQRVEETINGRNQTRPAYTFLLPSLIPPSINI